MSDKVTYEVLEVAGIHTIRSVTEGDRGVYSHKVAQFRTKRVADDLCVALNGAYLAGRRDGEENIQSRIEEIDDVSTFGNGTSLAEYLRLQEYVS